MKRTFLLFGLMLGLSSGLLAQQAGYSQTNLVSNTAGVATTTDPQLLNPWGISYIPGSDFWIANNNSGTSTLYDNQGQKDAGLVVIIPGATSNPSGNCTPGCPTGNVANGNGSYFAGGQFIFDTEDGLVTTWTGASNTATVAFDNSPSGAVYKGLALLNGSFLLAANFNSGKVDVLDRNFSLTSLAGSFTDPNLAPGFAPHGIHVINNQVYVTYAMQDVAKHDPQPGAGLGQVDVYDANGNFVSVFVPAGGKLNAPWGVVAAPATFGAFPNSILVGNFGDGTINAFDTTGKFLGQLTDSSNNVLLNPGLWDMVFGGGGPSGDPGTLYLTAGGSNQPNFATGSTTSVFASLVPAAAVGSPDFSLSLSPQSATVQAGGSTSLMVTGAAVGGFSGQIALSCTVPAGLTCSLSPSTISPSSSASSSTLTVSAAATAPPGGYGPSALLPGLGLFGTLFTARKTKSLTRQRILGTSILGLLLLITIFALGCGSSSTSSKSQTPPSQVILMLTGTSGSLSHSTPITITVN